MENDKKKDQQQKPIGPISKSDVNKQEASPEELQVVEPEFSLDDLPELEESGGDSNLGSGSGLLDLSLEADDTSLGGIFDEVYGAGSLKVEEPAKPKNYKVFRHDELMAQDGWKRTNNVYHDKYRAIVFVQRKSDPTPRAYLMFALSLRAFANQDLGFKAIKGIHPGEGEEDFFDVLRVKYLTTQGRKSIGIIRPKNEEYPRVAMGYSIGYNPKGEVALDIPAISRQSRELSDTIRNELNKVITGNTIPAKPQKDDKFVKYLTGEQAVDLYRRALKTKTTEDTSLDDSAILKQQNI